MWMENIYYLQVRQITEIIWNKKNMWGQIAPAGNLIYNKIKRLKEGALYGI